MVFTSPTCPDHLVVMVQDDPPPGSSIQGWCSFECPIKGCVKIAFQWEAPWETRSPTQRRLPFEVCEVAA